jgi:diguanylate cyclase (GGDEF)-like protein/PAS domain S-box-containing protein
MVFCFKTGVRNRMSSAKSTYLLVIDDDLAIRRIICDFFEFRGCVVDSASDGRIGLEKIREKRPDIVITDLSMPNMNGLEVVAAVSELDANLPIVMLSGNGMLGEAMEAIRKGAWDYISKPVRDLFELELIVNRCLERARLLSENRNYQNGLEQLVCERTAQLAKLFKAVEQSANAVVITDVHGAIEYVNPKFSQVTGYSLEEVLAKNPRILNSGRHPKSYYQELWSTINSGHEWRGEFANLTKDGKLFWELCSIAPIRDDSGEITSFVAIKEDITDRKAYEERLLYQAHHDELTGVYNRYYLQTYLELQMEIMNRQNQFLNLILLDIDNLKYINDTFGHEFGDRLLQEVAKRLKQVCGSGYVVARFVADEFIVVPPLSDNPDEPRLQAENLRSAMNSVFEVNGTDVVATASIGVVGYPEDGECVESLLKHAEATMFQAKKNGRNSIAYYTRELSHQLQHRFELGTRLHHALEKNEFRLFYQPQLNTATGEISGMEVLLRWFPEKGEPVGPDVFIPLLEENAQIVAVGEWVLWQSCSQCMEWQKQGMQPLKLSVNISALQFIRGDLDDIVRRVLDITGFDPSLLCLELTESMIMHDSARTIERMEVLTGLGVTLSMDDFGTGYSSLEYLGRLPISELKIDRSFISRMTKTRIDSALAKTIIAMGHGLEMELVAEGVETTEQFLFLKEKCCNFVQGYLICRPLPADDAYCFIQGWSKDSLQTILGTAGSKNN